MTAGQQIAVDDPGKPDVQALLERHLRFALGQTPPEHSFALDVDGLLDPAITFFSFRADGRLLGIGAIKRLGPRHAEIKSMHTDQAARGRGVGRAMLAHLSAGFVPCGPFAGYQPSEDNLFMTLELSPAHVAGR